MALEGIVTSKTAGAESLTLIMGAPSANGMAAVIMAAQSNFTYTISSGSGHTWTTLRNGGVGGQIGGRNTYIYTTPVTAGGAASITADWTGQGTRMNSMYGFYVPTATTAHEGDEDTESQVLPGPLTLTSDLIDEGVATSLLDVIVNVGLQNNAANGGAGWSDFQNTFDARFTQASEQENDSAGQGQITTLSILYDDVSTDTNLEAESVSATTNAGGTTTVRFGSIRLWFNQVSAVSTYEGAWQVI
jgi:hypothetical protein